jgi:hypothetical protein
MALTDDTEAYLLLLQTIQKHQTAKAKCSGIMKRSRKPETVAAYEAELLSLDREIELLQTKLSTFRFIFNGSTSGSNNNDLIKRRTVTTDATANPSISPEHFLKPKHFLKPIASIETRTEPLFPSCWIIWCLFLVFGLIWAVLLLL